MVAAPKGTGVEPATRPYVEIVAQIAGRAQLDSTGRDPFEFASKAIDAMAEAKTFEEMIAANQQSGLVPAEEIFNQPITVADVNFSKSAEQYAKDNLGTWVVITANLDNGDEIQIKSGAPNVVTFMFLLQSRGMLPKRLKIVGKPTANGTLQQIAEA